MLIGFLTALLSAVTSSVREFTRKYVADDFSSVQIGFLTQVYGTLLLFPLAAFFYLEKGVTMTPGLATAVLASSGVVVSTTYIYVEAMRVTDFSVTEPLKQITPIFVAALEPLVLGIDFRSTILGGALLGSIGSYIMVSESGFLKPSKNMRNKGAAMAVLVAFIYSIWALASRFGATNTHPVLFTYMTYLGGLIGFWALKRHESETINLDDYLRKDIFAMGAVTALSALVAIYAYSFISASEMTVIQQLSAVFGVLIGGRFFREEDLKRKMVGAAIIIAGVVLVI